MPLKDLLFNFSGRINRLSFWLGNLILVVVALSILLILLPMIDPDADWMQLGETAAGTHALALTQVVAFLAIIYPSVAIAVKRLNDLDRNPRQAYIYFVPWALTILVDLFVLGGPLGARTPFGNAVDHTYLFVSLLYIFDLGIRPRPGQGWFG